MAVTSSTQICNLALLRLGAETISSITEDSLNAGYCKFVYDRCVNWVLRKFEWPFAKKRSTLAPTSETNLTPYEYSYQKPNGVARILQLLDSDGEPSLERYMVMGDQIYTDQEDAILEYIEETTDVTLYDEMFVRVVYLMVAWEIAMKITQNNSLRMEVYQEFRAALGEATGMSAREGTSHPDEPTLWTDLN